MHGASQTDRHDVGAFPAIGSRATSSRVVKRDRTLIAYMEGVFGQGIRIFECERAASLIEFELPVQGREIKGKSGEAIPGAHSK